LVIGFVLPAPRSWRSALLAFGVVALVQYLLGVVTLLLVVPTALAALHQATATLLLTTAIVLLHTARPPPGARKPQTWSVAKTVPTPHIRDHSPLLRDPP
jgi:heme A synthase